MPRREDAERFVEALPVEEAFEPAQAALVRVAVKWLRVLTPEERREVRGVLIEFEAHDPELVPIPGREPIRVTLLRREEAPRA